MLQDDEHVRGEEPSTDDAFDRARRGARDVDVGRIDEDEIERGLSRELRVGALDARLDDARSVGHAQRGEVGAEGGERPA